MEKKAEVNTTDLRADIKGESPSLTTSTGVTKIHLDDTIEITTVGLIYGVEHSIQGEGFSARIFLDNYNKRIRVFYTEGKITNPLLNKLRTIAELNGFDKIIFYASKEDWQTLLSAGYVLEAIIKYYDRGKDVFVMSKFRSQERLTSKTLMEEILLTEEIMARPRKVVTTGLHSGMTCGISEAKDIPQLAALYSQIFETYPSPLTHEEYLRTVFQKTSLFVVIKEGDKIIAAASAEMNATKKAAELTDCATLKSHRGRGLMTQIIQRLETELINRNYICGYTLARARSIGMNRTFYNLNYEFNGRLVNNCDIYGGFEDMNIWTKKLGKAPHS